MQHSRHFLLLVCAALHIASVPALNVTIESASCEGFSYKVSGNLTEIHDIPAQGEILYGDLSQSFTLPSLVSPTINQNDSSFELIEELTYAQNITADSGAYNISLTLFSDEEMTNETANASFNASCSEVATSRDPSSTPTVTKEIYTTTVPTEEESTAVLPLSSSFISTTFTSSVQISSTNTALQGFITVYPTGKNNEAPSKLDQSHEKDTHIKEGVSVGVLGVCLIIVLVTGGALIKRRRRQQAQRNNWSYSSDWVESRGDQEVREA